MSTLEGMLRRIPGVYDDLLEASTPGRKAEPSDRSPDPREKPAPGNLGVIDHRHKLVRGLRAWVASVAGHLEVTDTPLLGESVERACAWLEVYAADLPADTRGELEANLRGWLDRAWSMLDQAPREPGELRFPPTAWEQTVDQRTAADILGCPVSTIWRRNGRKGGPVKLADVAPRCIHDLVAPTCVLCASAAQS